MIEVVSIIRTSKLLADQYIYGMFQDIVNKSVSGHREHIIYWIYFVGVFRMQKNLMIMNEKSRKESNALISTFLVRRFVKSQTYCNVPVTGSINGQDEARARLKTLSGVKAVPVVPDRRFPRHE